MSPFPIFHNLDSPASFPALSSYSAEQISLPLEQPLFNVHQNAADLAALEAISEDDLLAIVSFLFSSAPGAHSIPTGNLNVLEESPSEFQNDFTAAVRTRLPHPRVAHACDHCRRRKTKVNIQSLFVSILADIRDSVVGNSQCVRAVRKEAGCASGPL
jgi:hypothetical protein